jgi:hypothetical protein
MHPHLVRMIVEMDLLVQASLRPIRVTLDEEDASPPQKRARTMRSTSLPNEIPIWSFTQATPGWFCETVS